MSAMNTLKKFGLEQAFNYVPVVDFLHREQ